MAKKQIIPPVQKHSQRGKYVYKPIVSIIIVCSCGNKYVATRPQQKVCVRCLKGE